MKRIIAVALAVALCLCGCQSESEKQDGKKLFMAITTNNVQGVREALRNPHINLEKLPVKEFSNFRQWKEKRALAFAIDNNTANAEIVEMLIDAGADVNSRGDDGSTYLMNCSDEMEEILLKAGADVNAKNNAGETVVDVFLSGGEESPGFSEKRFRKKIALYEKYGGTITAKNLKKCLDANGYAYGKELLERLKKSGKDTCISEELEYAVCGENEKLLKYMKKKKISDNYNVLRYAAAHCNVEVLKELKKQGCDFGVKDEEEKNLIHIAAIYNNPQVVSYLLKEKINPNDFTDFYEYNALTLAVVAANRDNVQILRDAGMNWQTESINGSSTWLAACREGTKESIEIMLEEGYRPTDDEIIYGYGVCNESTFEALISNKIPYDKEYDDEGYITTGFTELCASKPELALKLYDINPELAITPEILEYAIESDEKELALKIINGAKDLNVCFTGSPLELAVYYGKLDLVKLLIENGADINYIIPAEGGEYHTVMHTAVVCPSKEILLYLLDHGGDVFVEDFEGCTPYDYAKESKLTENMRILKEYQNEKKYGRDEYDEKK